MNGRQVLALLAAAGLWGASAIVNAQAPAGREAQPPRPEAMPVASYQPVVQKYCVGCHNDRLKTGELSLEGRDLGQVTKDSAIWEKVVRKLSTGSMPPLGAPRPDAATTDGMVLALTSTLDAAAAAHPNPGRPMIHRLNRAEYANAVRDVLNLNIDVTSLLPPDELSSGFDNIADALGVSPLLIERYLVAADRVSAVAVGDREIVAGSETFVTRGDSHQLDHVEGLPLGTRGGLLIKYTFPLDATYSLSAKLYQTNNAFTRGLSAAHELEFSIDGVRVFVNTVGGPEDFANLMANPSFSDTLDKRLTVRVPVKAGEHTIGDHVRPEDRRAQRVRLQAAAGAGGHGGQRRRSAHRHRHGRWTLRCDGSRRHGKPSADFHVPADEPERRTPLRDDDRRNAGAARLPRAGVPGGRRAFDDLLRPGPREIGRF